MQLGCSQYNGFMLGILLLSITCLAIDRPRISALLFAVLLNLKHLYLSAAPFFFVHLLAGYVFKNHASARDREMGGIEAGRYIRMTALHGAVARLVALGSVVVCVFGISLLPFFALGQFWQLIRRLFPFGRGLVHAYWAPNSWALYTAADRALAFMSRGNGRLSHFIASFVRTEATASLRATSGLVGEAPMAVLPQVRPGHTALLVVLLQSPVLVGTWINPSRRAAAAAVAYCSLAAFLLGWHAHEKAVLPPLVIVAAAAPVDFVGAQLHARLLLLLSAAGHYAQLPLLHRPAEYVLARILLLLYHVCARIVLSQRIGQLAEVADQGPDCGDMELDGREIFGPKTDRVKTPGQMRRAVGLPTLLRSYEEAFLIGFFPLELFVSVVHPFLLGERLSFLPLLCTSVYCAVGVHYCTYLMLLLWKQQRQLSETHAFPPRATSSPTPAIVGPGTPLHGNDKVKIS
eukprot:scaffold99481_cov32-Tisochrysis_lutea.AAC.1